MDTAKSNIFEQTRAPKGKFRLVVVNEQEMSSSENDAAGLTIMDFRYFTTAKRTADKNVQDGITAEVFDDKNEFVYHAVRKNRN